MFPHLLAGGEDTNPYEVLGELQGGLDFGSVTERKSVLW